MLEKETQGAILDYLALKRRTFWRNNTGAFKTEHGSFIRYGTPGSPDIFCLWDGLLFGIEVKGPKGNLRADQIAFKDAMTREGGIYLEVRSLDDVIAAGL